MEAKSRQRQQKLEQRKSYLIAWAQHRFSNRFLQQLRPITTICFWIFLTVDFFVSSMSYFFILKIVVVVESACFCGEAFLIELNQRLTALERLWADGHELPSLKGITLKNQFCLWITCYLCRNYAQGYALTGLGDSGVEFRL
jgi:hypothetical protein